MSEAVEHVEFDRLCNQLLLKGLDLSKHCFPKRHPVTGKPLYTFGDEPHKLKKAVRGIRRLSISSTELHSLIADIKKHSSQHQTMWAPMQLVHCDYSLPDMQLMAVAKSQPAFTTIATGISGATDKQKFACADLLYFHQCFESGRLSGGSSYTCEFGTCTLLQIRCAWFHWSLLLCATVTFCAV